MEIENEEQLKKICIGLDVYKAKNRIHNLFPGMEDRVDIEFVESDYRRFVVTDCEYDKDTRMIKLKVTSNNPIRHLPSIYQENVFLRHYLMIFQHIMNETAITLDNLDNLFRPMETPSKFLPVLANWFGIDYDLLGDEATARKVLQYTIPLYKYRGTKRGMKALLYLVSGIVPEIIEGVLPFEALNISQETEITSAILDFDSREAVFCVYFPVYVQDIDKDLVKRIYRIVQNEKPVNTKGYLYFKKPEEKRRKTIVIEENMVSNSFISACRQAWLPVYVWTVDLEENMRKYLDMGVNGLISDKPYLVKEVLEDYPSQGIPSAEDYYFS